MSENGNVDKRLKNLEKRKRFGYEQPPAGGRPPIPPEVKAERKALKEMLNEIAPSAVKTLNMSLGSDDEKNRLRASEIILSHTVPRLEEVTNHDDRPLQVFTDEQLTRQLDAIRSSRNGDHSGNGASAQ